MSKFYTIPKITHGGRSCYYGGSQPPLEWCDYSILEIDDETFEDLFIDRGEYDGYVDEPEDGE